MTAGCGLGTVEKVDAGISPAPVTQAQPSLPGKAKVTVLKNGLTVLTLKDARFPLASVRLYVHAGSAYEHPGKAGISHLLEHMVFKGSATRAPGEVAREVESVGGDMNAATSFDYTVYYVDVPSEHWALGVDVIHDMIFNAALDPEELESEKKVVLAELERGEDTPSSRLFKVQQEQVWPDFSYRWPIIGFRETVESVTSEDLRNYVRTMYQPQSMLLVVVGDVDPDEVQAQAEKYFGGLENSRDLTPVAPADIPAPSGPKVSVVPGKWNKVYLSAALPIPGSHTDEAVALEVLGHLLGGDRTSRLYRKFKYEQRLVDDIWAAAFTLERGGMFMVRATLDADKVDEFWRGLVRELSGLSADSFSKAELERAKLNLEDALFQSKETISGLASKVGYFQFFENGLEGEENYLYTLKHMDFEQLQDMIDEYLQPGRLNLAILTPEGSDVSAAALEKIVGEEWSAKAGKKAVADEGERGEAEVIELGANRIVLQPDSTLPYTALSIVWPGGDGLLSPDRQGLASLTARALTRGTDGLGATEIQEYLSDRAASLAAGATRDTFSLSAKYPARFSRDMLGLVQNILLAPSFAAEEVDRVRQEQAAAIKKREDQPLGLAFRNVFPFLFRDSGYGYLHLGETGQVLSYAPAEVAGFWKKQSAQPFVLSVCGDFDREEVLSLARAMNASFQAAPEAGVFRFAAPEWNSGKTLDLTLPDRNQAHLMLLYPVEGSRSQDSAALSVLREVLAGQSGLLFRDLRDRQGLGYTVTAFMWQAPETGFLAFYIGTYPDKVEQAVAGFEKVIADLKAAPLPQAELDRAVNLLKGDYYRENQSLGSRASEGSVLLAKGFGLDRYRKMFEKAEKLTPEDIQKLAQKYLVGEPYVVTVKP